MCESVYESLYDSVHDLLLKDLGVLCTIIYPLQMFVNTVQNKMITNLIAIHLWH
jgi:hypothetical protein